MDFVDGTTVVTADYLDDTEELMCRYIGGTRLEQIASNQVRATIDQQGSLVTDSGKVRWVTTAPTVTVSGTAGAKNVYAVGGADSGGDPSNNTNKTFSLEIASGAASGANPRLLGTLTWDGSTALTNLRFTAGQQPPADLFNAFIIKPNDPGGVPLSIQGLAGQTTSYLQIGSSASSTDRMVLTNSGRLDLPVAGNTGGLRFAAEAASNLYRSAANTLMTDGNLNVAQALTVSGNVQINGNLSVVGSTTFSSTAGTSIQVVTGSAVSPSVFFAGDPNCGFFSPGTDQFAVTVNGTQMATVSTSGLLVAGGVTSQGNSRIGSNDAHTLGFFSVAGVARRTGYSMTGASTLRSLNVASYSPDNVANVLATLISDLQAYGLIG